MSYLLISIYQLIIDLDPSDFPIRFSLRCSRAVACVRVRLEFIALAIDARVVAQFVPGTAIGSLLAIRFVAPGRRGGLRHAQKAIFAAPSCSTRFFEISQTHPISEGGRRTVRGGSC